MQIIRHKKSESITETFHLPPQFWGASWTSLLLECILWHCLGCVLPGTWNLFSTKEKKILHYYSRRIWPHSYIIDLIKWDEGKNWTVLCLLICFCMNIFMHVNVFNDLKIKSSHGLLKNACFFSSNFGDNTCNISSQISLKIKRRVQVSFYL